MCDFFAHAMCVCLNFVCLSLLYAYKLRLSVICTTRLKALVDGLHEKIESPTVNDEHVFFPFPCFSEKNLLLRLLQKKKKYFGNVHTVASD